MYASCLFCNNELGTNEAIEHFPVGRRLAFDLATGRLWVVCPKCQRWNLSPLETRWEAIEEAERAFRGTKMRVSTEHIGLCRLRDGTELVRIGKPLRPEFAAWRYGDQFLRRRRRFNFGMAFALSGSLLVPAAVLQPQLMAMLGSFAAPAGLMGMMAVLTAGSRTLMRQTRQNLKVRGANGELLALSPLNIKSATLSPAGHAFEWQLNVPNTKVENAGAVARAIGVKERAVGESTAYLRDDAAKRVLATILPHVNTFGGSRNELREAVDLVDDAPSVHYLLHQASIVKMPWYSAGGAIDAFANDVRQAASQVRNAKSRAATAHRQTSPEVPLGGIPVGLRLALEMSLHEDDERRAMEGELQELEERWKDADAIAKIADTMFVSATVDTQLNELRNGSASSRHVSPRIAGNNAADDD